MTKYSPSLLAYSDIHQVLTAACTRGELTLTFDTPQAATTFVGRANNYRVLIRKARESRGEAAVSPFDHLQISRPARGVTVTIGPRGFNFQARDAEGNIIAIDPTSSPPELDTLVSPPKPASENYSAFLDEFEAELAKGQKE